VAGRYARVHTGRHEVRLLLAKNPAGWREALTVLDDAPVIVVVNAAEADGRDLSWLWDVRMEALAGRRVVAAGQGVADLSVRLSYAGVPHEVVPYPLEALTTLPSGRVDVLANYTAFLELHARLGGPARTRRAAGRPGGHR
jgi:hypothetical protein